MTTKYGRGILATAALVPVLAACTGDTDGVGGTAAPVGAPAATSTAATGGATGPTTPAGRPSGPAAPTGTAGSPDRTAAPTAAPTATPTATPTASSAAGRLAPGGYDVLLTSVDVGRRSISVDVVDYLTGEAAVRACREDGVRDPAKSCVNGYVRNTPTPVRTVRLATNAKITMSLAITAQPATLAAVAAGLPTRNLYSMQMGSDSVSTLDEIYRP